MRSGSILYKRKQRGELTIARNSDQAPQMVADILNSLPFESRLTHTRWCG